MFGIWDTDRDPLEALQAGDRGPFEAFVLDTAPVLVRFFRRLGAGEAEAEDLTQEVFLKLFQSASTYRPSSRFGPFAMRIARNAWIDRRRRGAIRPRPATGTGGGTARGGDEPGTGAGNQAAWEAVEDGAEAPLAALERGEEAARLRAALASLPDHHRLVFELGVVQELPYAEIGALLEIPEGTVKSRMYHAVRRLRELLGVETR